MVQFFNFRTSCFARDYWMLHSGEGLTVCNLRDELQGQDFPVMKSTTDKVRLRALYARCQRGLMSYEGLSLNELKLYVAQRALPPILGQKRTVSVLKAQLEQADDGTTFSRFSDLPPEIRQIIYNLYFKFIDTCTSTNKYQPPVTLASRGIRHESLPLFYESCMFSVFTSMNWHAQQNFDKALLAESGAFVEATSAQNFAHIRMMHIRFNDLRIALQMNLTNKATPIGILWYSKLRYQEDHDQIPQKRKDRLSAELCKIGLRIATREGPLKLRKSDLELLHETSWGILEKGWE